MPSYQPKNFDALIGLAGFSDQILKNHFILYQGYVANFNKLNDQLVAIEKNNGFNSLEYAELNRRLGWEWNGMRLHELYFENLTKTKIAAAPNETLSAAIQKEFGSLEMWQKDFVSMGLMRGVGWVILYYDSINKRLFNVWINEHDCGHLAGCQPLLILDVFEHAYLLDYGLKRADYIDAFFDGLNWSVINKRLAI